jgi:hypothetical protein
MLCQRCGQLTSCHSNDALRCLPLHAPDSCCVNNTTCNVLL